MLKTIIASVIIFGLLIFVHEFGHFIVARLVRVRVLEFAIGFGKELFGWCKDGTQYSLRLFPWAVFVACWVTIEEMHKEGSFQGKPLISRFAVIFAGPL